MQARTVDNASEMHGKMLSDKVSGFTGLTYSHEL